MINHINKIMSIDIPILPAWHVSVVNSLSSLFSSVLYKPFADLVSGYRDTVFCLMVYFS